MRTLPCYFPAWLRALLLKFQKPGAYIFKPIFFHVVVAVDRGIIPSSELVNHVFVNIPAIPREDGRAGEIVINQFAWHLSFFLLNE